MKKYSRLISFLLFIEYGLYLSLVASIFANILPNDDYALLVRSLVYGLQFYALVCVLVAIITGILFRKRLKLGAIAASLRAMLAALASLSFGFLAGAALFLLSVIFPLNGNAERLAQIGIIIGYPTSLIQSYFLSFRYLRKPPSLTSK